MLECDDAATVEEYSGSCDWEECGCLRYLMKESIWILNVGVSLGLVMALVVRVSGLVPIRSA